MKLISIFMDIEDPVNPCADDAALDFATLFSKVGIRGSFCVTGQKCRMLMERGRTDVLAALAPHCLGLHTDTHSVHPTTMELLGNLDYEAGCETAFLTESKGAEAFYEAFGRAPAFWGGAGNTWAPEIPHTLGKLGIPAYSYALTELPGKPIHRLNNCIALPQHVSVGEDSLVESPSIVEATLAAIQEVAQPWVGVFVGHPTRYRHTEFWDRDYARGSNPAKTGAVPPVPVDQYEQSLSAMRGLLALIAERWKVVGVDELLKGPLTMEKPGSDEIEQFKTLTAVNFSNAARWPIHRPDLDPTNIIAKTIALTDTLEVCRSDQ